MKYVGIVRKVDELGRIVLPKELRRVMDIEPGTPLEIMADGENIVLHKYAPGCIFCGGAAKTTIGGKHICAKCLRELKEAN